MKSANSQLYKISYIKKCFIPWLDALKTAIHSLVSLKIDYCNSLLAGLPEYQTNRLQNIMNCAASIISSTSKYEHITPILRSLHWLPVEFRIMFKVACVAFKALISLAPLYLTNKLHRYNLTRSLHSAGKDLLIAPKICTKKYGARSFAHAAPTVFNSLPSDNSPQLIPPKRDWRHISSLPLLARLS